MSERVSSSSLLIIVLAVAGLATTSRGLTLYPPNYSFETPALAPYNYYTLTDSSPDWKARNAEADIERPGVNAIYPNGYGTPQPLDGSQVCEWVSNNALVYQQLTDTFVTGKVYVLKVDAADSRYGGEDFHPTARISLCAGNPGDDPNTWTTVAELTQTLTGSGTWFTLSTPEFTADSSVNGKRIGIKLYCVPSSGVYDLIFDIVRIHLPNEPETVVIQADQASYITKQLPDENNDLWYYMSVNGYEDPSGEGSGGGPMYALVKFDLSSLPAGKAIQSATLGLYAYNGTPQAVTFSVHKGLTDWQEDTVTYNTFTDPGTPDMDYQATALFSDTKDENTLGWSVGNVLTAVRSWYSNASTNKGFFVVPQPQPAYGYLSLFSDDTSATDKIPYLSVTYANAVPGDTNGDGFVNADDLGIVLAALDAAMGKPNWDAQADLDYDEDVTSTDLAVVLANLQ